MKKLLLILVLLPMFAFSQFEVINNSTDWKKLTNGNVKMELFNKDGVSKLKYFEYSSLEGMTSIFSTIPEYEFTFDSTIEDLDKLYNFIIEKYNEKKVQEITLKYPQGIMILNFYKDIMGMYGFNFRFENKTEANDQISKAGEYRQTLPLSRKAIDKLFGKK